MHYSFHRRSMLALAALPLASAAAHATSVSVEGGPPSDPSSPAYEPPAPASDIPVTDTPLTVEAMIGKKLRVVDDKAMITLEYSPDRVNIEVDENHFIKRIFLG